MPNIRVAFQGKESKLRFPDGIPTFQAFQDACRCKIRNLHPGIFDTMYQDQDGSELVMTMITDQEDWTDAIEEHTGSGLFKVFLSVTSPRPQHKAEPEPEPEPAAPASAGKKQQQASQHPPHPLSNSAAPALALVTARARCRDARCDARCDHTACSHLNV